MVNDKVAASRNERRVGKKDKPKVSVSYSASSVSYPVSKPGVIWSAGESYSSAPSIISTITSTTSTLGHKAAGDPIEQPLSWSVCVDDTEKAPHAGEICAELIREYKADLALELELAWHDGITLEDVLELLEGENG